VWTILRPDAVAVLHDEKARASLQRYFAVMDEKLPARFLICKRTKVNVSLSGKEEELWRAHERGLKEFRRLLSRVDDGRVNLRELERPEVSLLDLKVELAERILKSCHFCERRCGVDRTAGETGVCGVGVKPHIASEFMHHGEEPELVPSYTIFFNGCTFKCQYCQNWDISQHPEDGVEASASSLAKLAEAGRKRGARNVNWVGGDPTPELHTILDALNRCEVNVPSVWNSNMYLSIDSMKLLFGTQDIYLTDFKYGRDACALRLSKVPNYFKVVARNHRLAFADAEVIIRHLVLPGHVECCTRKILEWIAENLGSMARTNVMPQFRPEFKAYEFEELRQRVTTEEMNAALKIAGEVGLKNVIS
jgi:putative pyruvate formate lyase activating enzyme